MGCLFLLFGLFAAGTLVVGLWAAAAILGWVDAPPVVVAAGLVAFIVVAIGAVAAARAFRQMTAPLDELIDASAQIEAGDLTVRVPVSGSREMRTLTRAFNQMSERLEAQELQRRTFLADVTHELRTPLTVLQGQLEAIDDGVYLPDQERIRGLLAHTRQMSLLVEDLHTISLAEVGGLRLELVENDLADVADQLVATYAPSAQLAGQTLRAEHGPQPVLVALDIAATRRVLGNLISNSIRHGAPGATIVLSVGSDGDRARIDVTDDGPGMDADLVARAFERFEKGADSDGSGLGLAIARDLVEAQGGTIALRSSLGQGATVSITWPVSGAAPAAGPA